MNAPARHPLGLSPYGVMVTLCFLLIGADRVSLIVGGMYVRAVAIPLLLASFFLVYEKRRDIRIDRMLFLLFSAFSVAAAASIYDSYDVIRSASYTIWLVFTILFVVQVFYNYALDHDIDTVLSKWMWVFRIHAVLACVQYGLFLMGVDIDTWAGRARLWFYESSLLGFFLSSYFVAALYLAINYSSRYLRDIVLCLGSVVSTASFTQISGVFLGVVVVLLASRHRMRMLWLLAAVSALVVAIGAVFLDDLRQMPIFQLTVGWFGDADSLEVLGKLLVWRSGLRVAQIAIGWDAFLQHMLTGIGIGADHTYFRMVSFPEKFKDLVAPWWWTMDLSWIDGMLFANLFVEVLGMTGLLGFVPFFLMIAYFVMSYRDVRNKGEAGLKVAAIYFAIFVMILMLQIDGGGYLRFTLWALIGLALGARQRLRRAGHAAAA